MIEFIPPIEGDAVGLRLSGAIGARDFRAVASLLRERREQGEGMLALLLHLDAPKPESPIVLWEQLKLGLDLRGAVRRIALVGDSAWYEAWVLAVGPLVPLSVRHFDPRDLEEAQDWVMGDEVAS